MLISVVSCWTCFLHLFTGCQYTLSASCHSKTTLDLLCCKKMNYNRHCMYKTVLIIIIFSPKNILFYGNSKIFMFESVHFWITLTGWYCHQMNHVWRIYCCKRPCSSLVQHLPKMISWRQLISWPACSKLNIRPFLHALGDVKGQFNQLRLGVLMVGLPLVLIIAIKLFPFCLIYCMHQGAWYW